MTLPKPAAKIVVLPGYHGTVQQPVLQHVIAALGEVGLVARGLELPRARPSEGLLEEVAWLRRALRGKKDVVLVGRSFGGRVALRYADSVGARALVLLGFPFRSATRSRPDDERLLQTVSVPTLVVQGDRDEKGPLEELQTLLGGNPHAQLQVLERTGHGFGARAQRQAAVLCSQFVSAQLSARRALRVSARRG